jgi:hypothetical protein
VLAIEFALPVLLSGMSAYTSVFMLVCWMEVKRAEAQRLDYDKPY